MSVDGEVRRLKSEADEPGWEVDPDDDWGVAVVATVGRQLKLRREAVGDSCVEIAIAPGTVHVRDSKNAGGSKLALTRGAWANFVSYASAS